VRKGKLTHIVFKTAKIGETQNFWESILLQENRSQQENYLSYEVGSFIVNFLEDINNRGEFSNIISHIGLEFSTIQDIDIEFKRVSETLPNINNPVGGAGKGPYRFYITDPNGIKIELETWDGSSD